MKKNGSISYFSTTGGGFDGNGDPIPVKEGFSDPIPCLIKTNTHNEKGVYTGGKFTTSSYEVLIEKSVFQSKWNEAANRVKLTNSRGRDLGEFQIQDLQYLDLVGRVKITV